MATTPPKKTVPDWYSAYARQMQYQYPDYTQQQRIGELYKRLSWVATAVDIIAVIAAMTDKSVYKIAGEDKEDVDNHDFEKLLLSPNPLQSGRSFIKRVISDYVLQNKAYIWLNIVAGSVVEMWWIPSTQIVPVASQTIGISHFAYSCGDGTTMPVPTEQVVYFHDYDPTEMIEPDTSLTSIYQTARTDMSMQAWNARTYDGNGRLPGVMTFADNIPDPEWKQIGDDINGAAATGNILRLRSTGNGDVRWIQTAAPPKDMEYYTGRNNNRNEIWNRIAPGLVSMLSESATEANARSGKATLIDLCVYPILTMFYECMTKQVVIPYYGADYCIEPDDIRVTDRIIELQEREKHAEILTVDEYRHEWGDEPYPDPEIGKIPFVQLRARNFFTAPPDNPATNATASQTDTSLPVETANNLTDINAQQNQALQPMKADIYPAMVELEKWERVANKSAAKAVDFIAYNIPARVVGIVRSQLSGGGIDVVDVFSAARKTLQQETSIIMALADAINRLADKK